MDSSASGCELGEDQLTSTNKEVETTSTDAVTDLSTLNKSECGFWSLTACRHHTYYSTTSVK